ncbi:hypothetical protein [Thalassovita sp.]|jgi:hypothetical protein
MRFTTIIVGWALAVTAISAIAAGSDGQSGPMAAPIHAPAGLLR